MFEGLKEAIDGYLGQKRSPEEYQKQLDKRAEEIEAKADWMEKEAVTRKKMAKARLRIRKAEGEMGRGYGRALKFIIVIVVVILVLFLVMQGC